MSSSSAVCGGNLRNCELLVGLAGDHAKCVEDAGITDSDSVMCAMAVGLVIEVWRNGPVEDMHSSLRGPSDAAMFAESIALHAEALKALTASNRAFGLLDFEDHLLDRTRPWAGTGGKTLKDLGYGFLGEYRHHVKGRVNALNGLNDHTCVSAPLRVYLVRKALTYGRYHKGMPHWPVIVERIGILLEDPDHSAWKKADLGRQARAGMPSQVQSVDQLLKTLLTNPSRLPVNTLEWLSDHFLHCAAPPYSSSWSSL